MGNYSSSFTFNYIMGQMLSAVPDTVDKREGSVIYDALAPAAAELVKVYIELDIIMEETFADTASLQYLIRRCNERGVELKGATSATVEGTFTPDTVEIPIGTRFYCGDRQYFITEKVSAGIYKLRATEAGATGNLSAGRLIPASYIGGLQTATITGLLIAGADAEETESLRRRYFDSITNVAYGGNVADYKEKVNEIEGVGGVKIYPSWDGGGTVKAVVISADYGVPSSTLISGVQTALDPTGNQGEGMGIAPIGHTVTVNGVTAQTINVVTSITFATGWSFAAAQSQIRNAISTYFAEMAEAWADTAVSVVRISQIESRVLDLECVIDVTGTQINGGTSNIQLAQDKIPILGTVTAT